MNTKQIVDNMETQIQIFGRGGKLIEHSFKAEDVQEYGQIELKLKNPAGSAYDLPFYIAPYKTVTLQQRAAKLTELDLAKALAEIGNAMIREHNYDVMIDRMQSDDDPADRGEV
jgi:hypothetical protein